MSQPSCCMNCKIRTDTCHTNCTTYHTEKLVNDLIAIEERRERLKRNDVTIFFATRVHKCQKAKRAAGKRVRRAIGRL